MSRQCVISTCQCGRDNGTVWRFGGMSTGHFCGYPKLPTDSRDRANHLLENFRTLDSANDRLRECLAFLRVCRCLRPCPDQVCCGASADSSCNTACIHPME